jgi:hypothetical protein
MNPMTWGLLQWSIAGVAAAVLVGIQLWGRVSLPSFGLSGDPDSADLTALKRLNVRYANCPEGKAALKVLATHFLDHGGDS